MPNEALDHKIDDSDDQDEHEGDRSASVSVDANAVGVVLYHNHPSGDPSPSSEDIAYTRRTRDSLHLIDIELVDHLIAGAHTFASMKRKGLI